MNKILVEILSKQFGVSPEEISENSCIVNDLGADSIDVVEVIMSLETSYKIQIDESEYEDKTTVGQLQELINTKIAI